MGAARREPRPDHQAPDDRGEPHRGARARRLGGEGGARGGGGAEVARAAHRRGVARADARGRLAGQPELGAAREHVVAGCAAVDELRERRAGASARAGAARDGGARAASCSRRRSSWSSSSRPRARSTRRWRASSREAQALLRQALTPELMAQMQKLESAAKDMNGDQSRDALRDLAQMQQRLKEQLERSAEMLKRAAHEGAMQTLSRRGARAGAEAEGARRLGAERVAARRIARPDATRRSRRTPRSRRAPRIPRMREG